MTEEQVKLLCIIIIENGNKQFTREQKEAFKHAINQVETPQQLLEVVMTICLF